MSLIVPFRLDEIIATFGKPPDKFTTHEKRIFELEQWENDILVTIPIPWGGIPYIGGSLIKNIRVHKKLEFIFTDLFFCLNKFGYKKLIKDCGGTYAFRYKRNSDELSTHAWGIAIDINVVDNPMGERIAPQPAMLVETFRSFGFSWGGYFPTPDAMHFQYAEGY